MKELIGKTILAFRGIPLSRFGKVEVPIDVILFDDKETYICFSEQNPYDYHDYHESARTISVCVNAKLWKKMFDCDGCDESTVNYPL